MIEPENPEAAKVAIQHRTDDFYDQNLNRTIVKIGMWVEMSEEQIRELAITYLNIPENLREDSVKDWLIKLGIIK